MKPDEAKVLLSEEGAKLIRQIKRSDQEPDDYLATTWATIGDLQRLVAKLQSTSGMTMRATEKDKALDKLAETQMWVPENKSCACRRVAECIFWAKQGVRA